MFTTTVALMSLQLFLQRQLFKKCLQSPFNCCVFFLNNKIYDHITTQTQCWVKCMQNIFCKHKSYIIYIHVINEIILVRNKKKKLWWMLYVHIYRHTINAYYNYIYIICIMHYRLIKILCEPKFNIFLCVVNIWTTILNTICWVERISNIKLYNTTRRRRIGIISV